MKNEIFQTIFNLYEKDIENLYKEESACLLIYRILPKKCQQVIMRVINIDDKLCLNFQDLISKINWSDILENHEANIKDILRLLYSIKIFPTKEAILNSSFKSNMLKIMNQGITQKGSPIPKKKNKGWNSCFDNGMAAFEKYLVGIYELDSYYIEVENDKIKFLINSGFLKKESQTAYKLTPLALSTLLGDKQLQIRTLILKYVITNKSEDNEKNFKFLHFLFSICTLDVGTVNTYINISLIL